MTTLDYPVKMALEALARLYTTEEALAWLHTEHPMLNDRRAIDLIDSGKAEEVFAVIEALNSDAFV